MINYGKLIQSCYYDLNSLTDVLTKLVSSYKLLVSAAEEYNRMALAKKDHVQGSMDRADDLGKIIDRLIKVLEAETNFLISYTITKNEYIRANYPMNEMISQEIEENLKHAADK